jgi:hypothetical protein
VRETRRDSSVDSAPNVEQSEILDVDVPDTSEIVEVAIPEDAPANLWEPPGLTPVVRVVSEELVFEDAIAINAADADDVENPEPGVSEPPTTTPPVEPEGATETSSTTTVSPELETSSSTTTPVLGELDVSTTTTSTQVPTPVPGTDAETEPGVVPSESTVVPVDSVAVADSVVDSGVDSSPVTTVAVQEAPESSTTVVEGGVPDSELPELGSDVETIRGVPVEFTASDGELLVDGNADELPPVEAVEVETLTPSEADTLGLTALGFTVLPGAGVDEAGVLRVEVDLERLAVGQSLDWVARAQLVELPLCAAVTPGREECAESEPVEAVVDLEAGTLTADIVVDPAAGVGGFGEGLLRASGGGGSTYGIWVCREFG